MVLVRSPKAQWIGDEDSYLGMGVFYPLLEQYPVLPVVEQQKAELAALSVALGAADASFGSSGGINGFLPGNYRICVVHGSRSISVRLGASYVTDRVSARRLESWTAGTGPDLDKKDADTLWTQLILRLWRTLAPPAAVQAFEAFLENYEGWKPTTVFDQEKYNYEAQWVRGTGCFPWDTLPVRVPAEAAARSAYDLLTDRSIPIERKVPWVAIAQNGGAMPPRSPGAPYDPVLRYRHSDNDIDLPPELRFRILSRSGDFGALPIIRTHKVVGMIVVELRGAEQRRVYRQHSGAALWQERIASAKVVERLVAPIEGMEYGHQAERTLNTTLEHRVIQFLAETRKR